MKNAMMKTMSHMVDYILAQVIHIDQQKPQIIMVQSFIEKKSQKKSNMRGKQTNQKCQSSKKSKKDLGNMFFLILLCKLFTQ
jgi:CRISPR/Cas system-associated endonuclease Cas1